MYFKLTGAFFNEPASNQSAEKIGKQRVAVKNWIYAGGEVAGWRG